MRMLLSTLFLAAALATAPSAAQAPDQLQAQLAQMEASMADAQAQAIRPGDDMLTCEQLEGEMVANMQDPAVQSVVAQNGAWAEGQMEQMNAARGRAQAQIATSMFMGIASSFIPGAGYAQMAQQRAMAAQQQQQAAQNMAQMMEMSQRLSSIMPQLMRGQRVYELAQTRQCAFTQPSAGQEPQN